MTYTSHYAFMRFGLGENPMDALFMAAMACNRKLPVPNAEEQAYIAERWSARDSQERGSDGT